ncbi:MAG: hypothetical protein ACK506_16225 [Pirellula sp.]
MTDKPKQNNSIHPGVILGGIVGVILLLARSPAPINPAPGPAPTPAPIASSIERETVFMMRDQCEGYRAAFRAAAEQLGNKITTEEQLLMFLASETLKARESAKRGFDQSFESEMNFVGTIPESEYARAREVLERIAKSFPTIKADR